MPDKDARGQAADAFCWHVLIGMHLGLSAEAILKSTESANLLQTWANIASAEGVLHDDDPTGAVVSHAVPYTEAASWTASPSTAADTSGLETL